MWTIKNVAVWFLLLRHVVTATDIEDLPDSLKSMNWAQYLDDDVLVVPSGKQIVFRNDRKPQGHVTQNVRFSLALDEDDETEIFNLAARLCTTSSGREGLCRRLQYCPRPEYLNSIDNFLDNACAIGTFYLGVCCPDQSEDLMRQLDPFRLSTPSPQAPASSASITTSPSTTQSATTALSAGSCGVRDAISTRILGGVPAEEGDWPWMAALFKLQTRHFCGGTLISDSHVLTAAHCLVELQPSDITVRLAEHNLQEFSPLERNFNVSQIFRHENYSKSTQFNDIAVLKLGQKVQFNKQIFPICLPDENMVLDDRVAFVTGWGRLFYGGITTPILHQAALPMWKNSDCSREYPKKITDLHVCAGYPSGKQDACQGDSGGPLKLETADRWVIVGIVSWGKGCGERGKPGVYTRVAQYIGWIQTIMAIQL